jgi:ABC-2 type transport system permease protein
MNKLVRIELYKIFSKPRTYIAFGVVFIIVVVTQLGFYFEGEQLMDFIIQNLKDSFVFEGKIINIYTVSYIILNTLWIQVPVLIALVTGDLIAGEANGGTFRLILTRPVSRTKLLFAKFFAGWTYTVLVILLIIFLCAGLGSLLFGSGDLLVLKGTVNIFKAEDALWRFALAYAYGILTMTVVASLAFMLSSFAENSIGPIIGTFAIIAGITIITTLGFSFLKPIVPYLFTTYLPGWQLFFDYELDLFKIGRAVFADLAYIIVFLSVTFYHFRRKDILS